MSGRVEALWTKRARKGVMDPAERVSVVEGQGIEGDANFGATRQVTIIEKEVFDHIRETLPDAEPYMRRANVMVSGVKLEKSRDKVLSVGGVKIKIRGETRPCDQMDAQCMGLTSALDPHWGGGAHGSVIQGGEIAVGDEASLD